MIPAETRYKTHNGKILAIVEAFKTWRHYLKICKHKVFVLTNHNNLCRFMDIKSLSSRQVRWAKELSRYHFRINYCQDKANGATNALSHFPQRNKDEEEKLWTENTLISSSFAVFINKCHFISSIYFLEPITFISGPHLRNARASTAPSILEHLSIGTSQRGPLSS